MAKLEQEIQFVFADNDLNKIADRIISKMSSGATKTIGGKVVEKGAEKGEGSAVGLLGKIAVGIGIISAFWQAVGPIMTSVMKILGAIILILLMPFLRVGIKAFADFIPVLVGTAKDISDGITFVISGIGNVIKAIEDMIASGLKLFLGEETAEALLSIGATFKDEWIPKLLAGGFVALIGLQVASLVFAGAANLLGFLTKFGFISPLGAGVIAAVAIGLILGKIAMDKAALAEAGQERIWEMLLGKKTIAELTLRFKTDDKTWPEDLKPPEFTTPEALGKEPEPVGGALGKFTSELSKLGGFFVGDPTGTLKKVAENFSRVLEARAAGKPEPGLLTGSLSLLDRERLRQEFGVGYIPIDEAEALKILGKNAQSSSDELSIFQEKTLTAIDSTKDFKIAIDDATEGSGLVAFKKATDDDTISLEQHSKMLVSSIFAIDSAVRQAQSFAHQAAQSASAGSSFLENLRRQGSSGGRNLNV